LSLIHSLFISFLFSFTLIITFLKDHSWYS